MICGMLTHPAFALFDFPKKVHYPVSCYRDGGENADGAEPAGGRAKQHLSESTDTKTECRDAYPRIPDPGRGREADRGCQAGAPRPPGRYGDPGCFPARFASRRDRRSGVVAGRVGPQSGAARPPGEERQARSPPYPRRRIAHAARAAAEHDGRFRLRDRARRAVTADAVNRLVKTIGARAKLPFRVHAHMLRHACGYALANAGHDTRLIQDWLGHRAIQHTARYTELSPTRFKEVWR